MTTPYQAYPHPAPEASPDDAHFFDEARAGHLAYRHCLACDRPHYFPRPLCPHCMSERTEWRRSAGRGEIYTFSVTRRGGPVPHAIAYVTLDEGWTMMTHIVDTDLDTIRVGQRVRLVHKPSTGDIPVACFTPAG